jgi:hypothetical protein
LRLLPFFPPFSSSRSRQAKLSKVLLTKDIFNLFKQEIEDHFNGISIQKDLDEVALLWDNSFSFYGFAIIIGHNVLEKDLSDIEEEMEDFFNLTTEQKMVYNHGYYGHPMGG